MSHVLLLVYIYKSTPVIGQQGAKQSNGHKQGRTVADPGGGAGGARPPFQKNNKKLGPIFVQFCS